jgi:hypothetical protein
MAIWVSSSRNSDACAGIGRRPENKGPQKSEPPRAVVVMVYRNRGLTNQRTVSSLKSLFLNWYAKPKVS